MKPTIYDTTSVQFTISKSHLKALIDFLTTYRDFIDPTNVLRQKLMTKASMSTSMSQVYNYFISSNKYDNTIRTMTLDKSISSIPEMLTFQHIPLDMLQIADTLPDVSRPIRVFPEYNKNIVINTTSMTTSRNEIADTLAFHSRVVRDLLSRSYYKSTENWLNPNQVRYLVKIYSMTISQALTRVFHLETDQRQRVGTIFAYFYLTRLIDPKNAKGMIVSNPIDMGLMRDDNIQDTIDFIETRYPPQSTDMTLDMVFDLINDLNIPRMNNVNRRILNSQLGKIGPDMHTSAIALEYPPYFIYLIGLAASGAKNKMTYLLKNTPRGIPNANEFMLSFLKNDNVLIGF